MKTQPYQSPYAKPPTSPTGALLALLTLALLILFFVLFATSCAELRQTTWSVSYQDQEGETFTVTRVGRAIPIHPEK